MAARVKLLTESLLEDEDLDKQRSISRNINPVHEEAYEGLYTSRVYYFLDVDWMSYYRLVRKSCGYILHSGKRERAFRLMASVFSLLFWKYRVKDPERFVFRCLDLVSVYFRSRPRRSSGRVYQVPEIVLKSVARRKGLKLLISESRKRMRKDGGFVRHFCEVLLEVSNKKGPCMEQIQRLEKWAVDNAIYMRTLGKHGRRRRRPKL